MFIVNFIFYSMESLLTAPLAKSVSASTLTNFFLISISSTVVYIINKKIKNKFIK